MIDIILEDYNFPSDLFHEVTRDELITELKAKLGSDFIMPPALMEQPDACTYQVQPPCQSIKEVRAYHDELECILRMILERHYRKGLYQALTSGQFGTELAPIIACSQDGSVTATTWEEKLAIFDQAPHAVLDDIEQMLDVLRAQGIYTKDGHECSFNLIFSYHCWDLLLNHPDFAAGYPNALARLQAAFPQLKKVGFFEEWGTEEGDYAMLVCDHPAQVSSAYCVYQEKAQPVIDPNTIDFQHGEELTYAVCTKAYGFVVTNPSLVGVMKGL